MVDFFGKSSCLHSTRIFLILGCFCFSLFLPIKHCPAFSQLCPLPFLFGCVLFQWAKGTASLLLWLAGASATLWMSSAGGGLLPAGGLRPAGWPWRPPGAGGRRKAFPLFWTQGVLSPMGRCHHIAEIRGNVFAFSSLWSQCLSLSFPLLQIIAKRGVKYLHCHGPKVHQELWGMSTRDAMLHFIKESCQLEDVPVTFYRLQKVMSQSNHLTFMDSKLSF